MSKVRKFYLENAAGERRDLNGKERVWFTEPVGLGITLAQSYADLGYGFFSPISTNSDPQQQPGGTMTFTGPEPYADYRELVNWMSAAEGLELVYLPYGSEEYRRKIDVNYIS